MTNANRLHALCSGAALAVALIAGCSGSNGGPGPAGTNGTSCSVSRRDGGAIISCTDGTSVTVPSGTNGMNGMNGASAPDGGACTVTKNADAGTYTLDCGGDAGVITVLPAIADYATMTADEKAQAAIDRHHHQRQLPRRRTAGGLAQGHRAPRLRRQGPLDGRGHLALLVAQAGARESPAPPAA